MHVSSQLDARKRRVETRLEDALSQCKYYVLECFFLLSHYFESLVALAAPVFFVSCTGELAVKVIVKDEILNSCNICVYIFGICM